MRTFVAILALVAVAAADVSHIVRNPEADAQIVAQEADVFPDQYRYGYETSNGIKAQESGVLKNPGRDDEAIEATGSVSYPGPDGNVYSLTYVANENGFQASGAHLPTPPAPQAVPEYILRSIEYIRTHPPKDTLSKP